MKLSKNSDFGRPQKRLSSKKYKKIVFDALTFKSLRQVRQTSQSLVFIDFNIIIIKWTGSLVIFAFISFFFFFA